MGVKDLWKLLEPAGRPVDLEQLRGLVIAIDVSVWLHQAVHGARDREGQPLQSAHLALLFSRICKLLNYQIKPVFVFDGATPALKQQTLAQRHKRRQSASRKGQRAEERKRSKYMQARILQQMTGDGTALPPPPPPPRTSSQPDMFDLPPLPEDVFKRERSPTLEDSTLAEDVESVDITSSDFSSLPPQLQHEILQERQELERRAHTDPASLPSVAGDFSSYQLSRLMQRSKLNRQLEDVRKSLRAGETAQEIIGGQSGSTSCEVEASRIMSSDSAHYILVKGVDLESSSSQDELGDVIIGRDDVIDNSSVDMAEGQNSDVIVGENDVVGELKEGDVTEEVIEQKSNAQITHRNERESSVEIISESPSPQSVEAAQAVFVAEGTVTGITEGTVTGITEGTVTGTIESTVTGITEGTVTGITEGTVTGTIESTVTGIIESTVTGITEGTVTGITEGTVTGTIESTVTGTTEGTVTGITEDGVTGTTEDGVTGITEGTVTGTTESTVTGITEDGVTEESVDVVKQIGNIHSVSDTVVTSELATADPDPSCSTSTPPLATNERGTPMVVARPAPTTAVPSEPPTAMELLPTSVTAESGVCERGEGVRREVGEGVRREVGEGVSREVGDGVSGELWEEGVLELSPEEAQCRLKRQVEELGRESERQRRVAAGVTSLVYREAQELLSLFGLPYIVSPMEAEAQCAHLDHTHQTHGTVTDDSDVFLFGGQRTYRHFFSQDHQPTLFTADDIYSVLGLTRQRLVCLAYLLGSDYTPRLDGVGVVNAMEVIGHFKGEGLDILQKLKAWHSQVNSAPGLTLTSTWEKKLCAVELPAEFPSDAVWQAYLEPEVDTSTEQFQWGTPDLDLIRKFMSGHLGWNQERVDSVLLPVLKRANNRERTIMSYFAPSLPTAPVISSKRLRKVVARITDRPSSPEGSPTPKRPRESSRNGSDSKAARGIGTTRGRGRGRGKKKTVSSTKLSASSSSSSDDE